MSTIPKREGVAMAPAQAGRDVPLEEASLGAVLLHGLIVEEADGEEGNAGLAILREARDDLRLLAELVVARHAGGEVLEQLGPGLERIVRRLDVGLEVDRRLRRGDKLPPDRTP